MKRIPLRARGGEIRAYAVVDDADFDWLNRWPWHLDSGYAARMELRDGKRRPVRMHRQILGLGPGDKRQGDHINRDRLDHRRANLRVCTRGDADNRQNVGLYSTNTSGYRGVGWDKSRNKWMAYGHIDDKMHNLGRYDTAESAAEVAAAFRREHMPFSQI